MKNSHYVIYISVVNRVSGIRTFLENKINRISQRPGAVQRYQILSVSHNISRAFIIQLEDIGNHLRFPGFQNSLLMPFIHHGHNLFFRHVLLNGIHINSNHFKEYIRQTVHQSVHRKGENHQSIDNFQTGITPFLRGSGRASFGNHNSERNQQHNHCYYCQNQTEG